MGTQTGCAGFTLIELLVVVALVAILQLLAAPALSGVANSMRLTTSVNTLFSSLLLARSEAIKRNSRAVVCKSATGNACITTGGWQQGWIVFNDKDDDGVLDDSAAPPNDETLIQRQQALSADYRLTGNVYSIAFQSVGAGSTQATLKLCRATPSPGNPPKLR